MPSPRGAFRAETQVGLLETSAHRSLLVGVCPRCAVFRFVCLFLWLCSSFATSLPRLQTEYSSSRWETQGTDKQGKEPPTITPQVRELSAPLPGFLPSSWSVPSTRGTISLSVPFSTSCTLSPKCEKLDEEVASSIQAPMFPGSLS